MNIEKHPGEPMPPIVTSTPSAPPPSEPHGLDITDPAKWQMKVRVYLESLTEDDTTSWVDNIRMITTMAASISRDKVSRHATRFCAICDHPFKDGRPAGEAGYFDADRNYIKLYICDQSEYSDLMKFCHQKEEQVARVEERATAAARKAAKDARSAVMSRTKV